MKKRTLTLTLVLALLFSITTIAMASSSTDGSITFTDGTVIIIPPGCTCCPKCCDCDCKEDPNNPCDDCPCPCTCDDEDYDNFFVRLGVENNLYFGEHALTVFGVFDSANKPGSPQAGENRYTTDVGKYTGVEIINQTANEASIYVSISVFRIDGVPTLDGAELTLVSESAIAQGDGQAYTKENEVLLSDEPTVALTVNRGREVKAAWYGLLETLPGTAEPGDAQAELTWTDQNGV